MTRVPDALQLAFRTLEEVEAEWEAARSASAEAAGSAQALEALAQRLVEVADEFAAVSARVVPSAPHAVRASSVRQIDFERQPVDAVDPQVAHRTRPLVQ